MPRRPAPRRSVMALAATALVWSILSVAPPSGGARADTTVGLDVATASSYVVDPGASVVRARSTLTFTNTTVDQAVGTSVRRQYFTGFSFPVPVGSTAERATTTDGTVVPITSRSIPDDENFVLYAIEFPEPLFSGEHLSVEVTYDITGRPPRSADPSRVNPAYVAFTAYGIGDEGEASIDVRIPAGFAIDTFGDDDMLDVSTAPDGSTTYRVTAIPDPGAFALFVSARNDDALTSRRITGRNGERFLVRGWPDDPEWQAFVVDEIDRAIPLLAELLERPWPIEQQVEIRQAVTPYLYGYAGWFSAAEAELEIGEDLDPQTVVHELSHAWFNSRWFAERWANEGLAQVYTASTVALLGGAPSSVSTPDAADPAAIPLVDWGSPRLEQGADATETFGYATSHWVMQRIVDEVGFEGIADVIDVIEDGAVAYRGDDTTPPSAGLDRRPADWRRLLDLLEEVAASTRAAQLIADHVVGDVDAEVLAVRADARERYAALERTGGTWAPPRGVRQAMGRWGFEQATDTIERATATIGRRNELRSLGDALQLDLTSDLEVAYEDAVSLDDVDSSIERRLAAAEVVGQAAAAVAANRGVIEHVGLIGADPTGHVDSARTALAGGDTTGATEAARRALDDLDDAATAGLERVLLVMGALAISIVTLLVATRRHRRRGATQAAAEA